MTTGSTTEPDAAPAAGSDPARSALHELDGAGVRWCLLRGERDLSDATDIDILVAKGDLRELDRALASAGFVQVPSWGYGTHTFFLRYDSAVDRWTKFDVVTELAFGAAASLTSGAEVGCLARRQRAGPLWRLHPDDAFWALLLHRVLDKRAIDRQSADRLRELGPRAGPDGPLARAVAAAAPPEWPVARILEEAVRGDLPVLAEALGPALARSWGEHDPLGTRRRRWVERWSRGMARVGTAWRRPGLGVALVAPDGAGKSSLVDGLKGSFPLPVRSIYLAPFTTPRPGSPFPARGLRTPLRFIRIWRGWLTGRYHVARGRLVLFDRYPLDARVAPRRPIGPAGRLRRWAVGRSCPAPELVLVLDAPGRVLYERTGELDAGTLESERRDYRRLAGRLRRSVVIDATREPDEVRRLAVDLVWRAWTSRWRPRARPR